MILLFVSICLIAYPLLVYFGLSTVGPAWLVAGLLALALLRLLVVPAAGRKTAAASLVAIVLLVAVGVFLVGELVALRFYPVVASLVVFSVFTGSLFTRMPVIERIARLREPDLPPAAVRYTRRLTMVWSALIFCNALVAFWTALYASMEVWALYNGLVSYLLLGSFFTVEWIYREKFVRPAAEQ